MLNTRIYKLYPTPQDGRRKKMHQWAQRLRLPYASKTVLFLSLVVAFGFVFSSHTEGSVIMSPKAPSTVTTKNKKGVTSPIGLQVTTENKAVLGVKTISNARLKGSVAAIVQKPVWSALPLFTDPSNGATQYALANPSAGDASYIARMGQVPVAQWFGDWNTNVASDVSNYVSDATSAAAVPVVVLYNIPNRDCGGYSIGGAANVSTYTNWVTKAASGIANRTAIVILEPDALGALDCLPADQQPGRLQAISEAVNILKQQPNVSVYIDAGTAAWQSAATMSSRLKAANIGAADGFSLNISYFLPTNQTQAYGDQLSPLVGNKHYVIDTSRNGGNHSVTGMQCNPSFASLGDAPTFNTGNPLNDALLWIKIPWESDGDCNGSPGPGMPYWNYAVQLAKNAGW